MATSREATKHKPAPAWHSNTITAHDLVELFRESLYAEQNWDMATINAMLPTFAGYLLLDEAQEAEFLKAVNANARRDEAGVP